MSEPKPVRGLVTDDRAVAQPPPNPGMPTRHSAPRPDPKPSSSSRSRRHAWRLLTRTMYGWDLYRCDRCGHEDFPTPFGFMPHRYRRCGFSGAGNCCCGRDDRAALHNEGVRQP